MSDATLGAGRNGVEHTPNFLAEGRSVREVARVEPSLRMPALADGPALSPSLLPQVEGAPAHELKFLLDADCTRQVEAWAAHHLTLDAHADPALGGAYHTASLYLDTPALDVYHRVKPFRRRKFRVRRYGAADVVFLERKTRSGDRVRKRRSVIPCGELAILDALSAEDDWPGSWFRARVLDGALRPVCLVGYERLAYLATTMEGPLRLTLDRHVRCLPAVGWRVDDLTGGLPLLEGQAILELKFRGALPGPFKGLIEAMRLAPGGVSKYRLGVRAWGLDGGRGADA